jgi:hypothetical protein
MVCLFLQTVFAKTEYLFGSGHSRLSDSRAFPTIPERLDGSDQRELSRRWSACASILSASLARTGGRGGLARVARDSGTEVRRLGPSAAEGPTIRSLFHDLTRRALSGVAMDFFKGE